MYTLVQPRSRQREPRGVVNVVDVAISRRRRPGSAKSKKEKYKPATADEEETTPAAELESTTIFNCSRDV